MSQPTAEELAQVVANHFRPPFRAEEYEYVRDDQGKVEIDENGFRKIRYFERDYMDAPNSAAMITKRIWVDGESQIQTSPLTHLEIAEAVLTYYNLEKKT